jgi:pSer/pThr/pTyr-binding forkhead associated (FHA) protein
MKLKLLVEKTGQQYTLKPSNEYVVGSGLDCDIIVDADKVIGERHLKLSFDANAWRLLDLGSPLGTFINDQQVTDYWLTDQARVRLGDSFFLRVFPEGSAVAQQIPSVYQQPVTTPTPVHAYDAYSSGRANPTNYPQSVSRDSLTPLQVLTWRKFVFQQASQQATPLANSATWFHLTTGYRNTPWIRGYSEGSHSNNFNSFDGYVIPNFKGSVETVIIAVRDKMGLLRNYKNTDCFIARLTDAHIADSATQRFFGVELFPIVRESGENAKPDFRDFTVISYHRVRTYLLIEKYGADLFVSWITRFEPAPTSAIMILWLVLAVLFTLGLFATQNGWLIILPLTLWFEVHWAVPQVMQSMNILPKRANANLFTGIIVIPSLFIMLAGAGYVAARSSLGM